MSKDPSIRINTTISFLQDQRNSALDALLTKSIDFKLLNDDYEELKTSMNNLYEEKENHKPHTTTN